MDADQISEENETNLDVERVKSLLRCIMMQKEEMYDYLTGHIRRGGYYYRNLCMALKKTYLTITILGNKINVEFSNGMIVYENDNVSLLMK